MMLFIVGQVQQDGIGLSAELGNLGAKVSSPIGVTSAAH